MEGADCGGRECRLCVRATSARVIDRSAVVDRCMMNCRWATLKERRGTIGEQTDSDEAVEVLR